MHDARLSGTFADGRDRDAWMRKLEVIEEGARVAVRMRGKEAAAVLAVMASQLTGDAEMLLEFDGGKVGRYRQPGDEVGRRREVARLIEIRQGMDRLRAKGYAFPWGDGDVEMRCYEFIAEPLKLTAEPRWRWVRVRD